MKKLLTNPSRALLLVLALMALGLAGCATTEEAENTSARPWNAPRGYDSAIPSQMMEGR